MKRSSDEGGDMKGWGIAACLWVFLIMAIGFVARVISILFLAGWNLLP